MMPTKEIAGPKSMNFVPAGGTSQGALPSSSRKQGLVPTIASAGAISLLRFGGWAKQERVCLLIWYKAESLPVFTIQSVSCLFGPLPIFLG